jgi:hypothetical protein
MNALNFRTDSLESKLFALGQATFEQISDSDIFAKFPESFPSGRNNGRSWNARKRVADATGWVMRSRNAGNASSTKPNSAIEHKASMSLSATFKTAWNIHMSACDGMPSLFSQETPELIISDLARDWLQKALLADKPNQFVLSCSMANQAALESDFRFLGVESRAMLESRIAAERSQNQRDGEYIAGLEKKGFIVISPDGVLNTGIMASLNRLEIIVNGMLEKHGELVELKATHKKLAATLDRLTCDDLSATLGNRASIENECAGLAERIRRANESSAMIAGVDHASNIAEARERLDAWIAMQSEAVAKFQPLLEKANSIAAKVIPPSQQFTHEQETRIAGVMAALDCSRDEAIATMKAKGKL